MSEMSGKKITLIVKSSPFRGSFCEEALRATLGMNETIDENKINIVFVSDGVWFAMEDMNKFMKYTIAFTSLKMPLYLEKESLEEKGIKESELASGFTVKDRSEISKILLDAEAVISY